MVDIIRCTRDYHVEKDNWYPMFEFIKDFANHSLSSPKSFVENYIMDEVNEMMAGLRNIISNPSAVIDMFKKEQRINSSDYCKLRLISPMSSEEKMLFNVFPKEMPVIFKSEKLVQATKMLEKLKELSNVYSKIDTYIGEILNMVITLRPEIEKTIKDIQEDIDELTNQKEAKEEQKEKLRIQMSGFDKELDDILSRLPEKTSGDEKEAVCRRYDKTHPEYVKLKDEFREVQREFSELCDKINSRSSLIERLSSCANDFALDLPEAVQKNPLKKKTFWSKLFDQK